MPVIERNPVISNPEQETSQNTQKDINPEFNSDKWWKSLNDENLNTIVDLVLENNKSVIISKLN